MRKLFALVATGFLVFGMTSAASAALMNWSGTAWVLLADSPVGVVSGGGVATINGSAGGVPAHLTTRRLAQSRGQIRGTFTRIVTDPDTIANGVAAIIYDGVGGGTGTQFALSGGAASTSTGGGTAPVHGVVKVCLLSTACTM